VDRARTERVTDEETFKVAIRLGGAEIIGFEITARSSRMKRWAFFGLLTMIVLFLIAIQAAPQIERFMQ
jgi:hypothetical protein